MSQSPMIFSVIPKADFGLEKCYLDEAGYYHILIGHRDMANFMIMGVQETVQNPTHVYRSSHSYNRLQFTSNKVVTAKGHPLNVIIQIENRMGRVITASPKNKISGDIIWDELTGLYVSYDNISDILYFSQGDSRISYATDSEAEPKIWFRFHEEDESPAGVTVFDAADMWLTQREKLTKQVSEFLHVEASQVEKRVRSLLLT